MTIDCVTSKPWLLTHLTASYMFRLDTLAAYSPHSIIHVQIRLDTLAAYYLTASYMFRLDTLAAYSPHSIIHVQIRHPGCVLTSQHHTCSD